MALEEHDREDLLRDGRQMVLRGECQIDGVKVVVGFRAEGQLSLYCGPDPVFQFNAQHHLRRVFFEGNRYAAREGRLVQLNRETRGGRVEFVSRPIDGETQASLLSELHEWFAKLRTSLESNDATWRSVGGHDDGFRDHHGFRDRLGQWLDAFSPDPVIANAPNA